jgi:hypothetical protein
LIQSLKKQEDTRRNKVNVSGCDGMVRNPWKVAQR